MLLSQFLKGLRDAGHDIDAVAESLHRKNNPNVSPPSKVDRPCDFMQPLVQVLLDAIAQVAPAKQDTVAMRQLQDMQAQLHAAQEKLRRAGMEVTPDRTRPSNVPLPAAETPELNSDVSCSVPVDPPLSKRQKTQPSAKTSTTQRSLQAMFAASAPSGAPVQEDAAMTMSPDQVLEPKAPSLRSHPLVSTTGPSVKNWYESVDTETQQMAKKIIELLQEQRYGKERLQTAAAQYGIPVGDALKLTPKSLIQVISIGAAMSA